MLKKILISVFLATIFISLNAEITKTQNSKNGLEIVK